MLTLVALATIATIAKPVAVMVHGAGGGGWEFKFWKPIFEKAGYRVVAKDLLPSRSGLSGTTFASYVAQVVAWPGERPAVLIGASMGGVIALKAGEELKPKALVLVCSTLPGGVGEPRKADHPEVIRWANGPYQDTVASMPDSDEATHRFAHLRWRDESGAVLNEIAKGVNTPKPACPTLCIIPEADDSINPADQQALAKWAGADTYRYQGMSHVGPLLSTRATEVAENIVQWLKRRRVGP